MKLRFSFIVRAVALLLFTALVQRESLSLAAETPSGKPSKRISFAACKHSVTNGAFVRRLFGSCEVKWSIKDLTPGNSRFPGVSRLELNPSSIEDQKISNLFG